MTPADREPFEDFLRSRVDAARSRWKAVKAAQPLSVARSYAAPEPDGTLLRRQARAFPELTVYLQALKDLTAMTCEGTYRPELVQEWRAVNRKPMTTAHPETPSASSQDQSTKRRA